LQSDLSLTHEFKVSKSNENMRLSFRADAFNVFNQHAPLALYNSPLATGVTTPSAPASSPIGWDYLSMMTNFDYMTLMNAKNTTSNVNGQPNTLASRYGQPIIYQSARNMRLEMKFIF
jgi:hypothetical protein